MTSMNGLHLYCWQESSNPSLSSIIPRHVFAYQRIEYLVACASCLELAKCEEKEEVKAVRDPAERSDARENEAKPRHTVTKLTTLDLAGTIVGVIAKYEPVYDGEDWYGGGGDEGAD